MADEFTKAALYGIKTFNKKVKEKIGMERLVMLLDIYEEEVVGVHSVGEYITEKDEAWIISKKFGFIKWLVENDKIDMPKAKYYSDRIYYEDYGEGGWGCKDYEYVIMLLSISNSPIEDLLLYLK